MVDERPQPERIEIELTTREPTAARNQAPAEVGPGPDSPTLGASAIGWLGTERGRLVATASLIGVVAMLLGVVLGRAGSGGDEGAESDAVSSTTVLAATTSTTAPSGNSLPRVLPETPPTTTPPAPSGASSSPTGPVKGIVEVAPELSGQPVELIVLTIRGEVVQLDLSTGLTVSHLVEGSQFGPPSLHAGQDWILIPSFDERGGSTVLRDDGTRSQVEMGTWWPMLHIEGSDVFWRIDDDAFNVTGRGSATEVGFDGQPTGPTLELPGYPQFVDPLGGLVIEDAGGTYIVGVDGPRRFTAGRLIALGRRKALVYECDEVLVCGHAVVDRASGVRTPIELDPVLGLRPSFVTGQWGSINQFDAAEDAIIVSTWGSVGDGQPLTGVIDLSAGSFTEMARAIDIPSMAWGPDGRFVFWLDRGQMRFFDRSTGASELVSADLGTLNAFTLRAALPSVDVESTIEPTSTSSSPPTTAAGA